MTGKRIYQLLLSFLCILLAVLICSAAVRICRDGSRRKAEHPMETVYTKEAVEDASAHIAPLFIVVAVMAGGGIVLGIQDDRKVRPSVRAQNADKPDAVGRSPDRKKQVILRAVLLAAAALFIIAGICNGSMKDTFVKAANICTECIGLG